jgi:hypothetical protein
VELEFLLPGTAADLKTNVNDKNQKPNKDFQPEPKPNSEPLLIGLASATLAQNAVLCARASSRQSSFQSVSR